jgi:hypothetical protein
LFNLFVIEWKTPAKKDCDGAINSKALFLTAQKEKPLTILAAH